MSKIAADVLAAEDTDDGLTSAQRLAMACLLRGGDDQAAAKAAGVSARTVRRWRAAPGSSFADDLATAERLAIADAAKILGRLTSTAATVAGQILTGKTSTTAAKLKACDTIFRAAVQLRQYAELEREVADLRGCVKAMPAAEPVVFLPRPMIDQDIMDILNGTVASPVGGYHEDGNKE